MFSAIVHEAKNSSDKNVSLWYISNTIIYITSRRTLLYNDTYHKTVAYLPQDYHLAPNKTCQ